MRMEPILVVDDEHAIADLVCLTLENAGYRCKAAYSGAEAADKIETGRWALVVLDVMLPDHDGCELKTFIGDETPVIFLTAKTDVAQRVKGLAAGAQDYICKPFEPAELVARVEAALRRTGRGRSVLQACGVTLDPVRRTVCKNGVPVPLTPREYDLLLELMRNKNAVLYRNALYERVWGEDAEVDSRTLDLHIQRLRKKLGLQAAIKTVYKIGYELEDSP